MSIDQCKIKKNIHNNTHQCAGQRIESANEVLKQKLEEQEEEKEKKRKEIDEAGIFPVNVYF